MGRVIVSLLASALIMGASAGTTTPRGFVWKGTHSEVRCGLPFGWLIVIEPSPEMKSVGATGRFQVKIPVLALDLCLWSLLVFAVLSVIVAYRNRRQRDPSRCSRCDYSLVGLETARCPECGTPFNPDRLGQGEGQQNTK